jgi:hypothetical protein
VSTDVEVERERQKPSTPQCVGYSRAVVDVRGASALLFPDRSFGEVLDVAPRLATLALAPARATATLPGHWHRDPEARVAIDDLRFVGAAERQVDAPGAVWAIHLGGPTHADADVLHGCEASRSPPENCVSMVGRQAQLRQVTTRVGVLRVAARFRAVEEW